MFESTLRLICKLRKTSWSDGVAVEAQDYVRAFRRLLATESKSPAAALLRNLKNAMKVHSGGASPETLGVRADGEKVADKALQRWSAPGRWRSRRAAAPAAAPGAAVPPAAPASPPSTGSTRVSSGSMIGPWTVQWGNVDWNGSSRTRARRQCATMGAASLGKDAAAVMLLDQYLPTYYEIVASVSTDMVGANQTINHNSLHLNQTMYSIPSIINDVSRQFFEYVGETNREKLHNRARPGPSFGSQPIILLVRVAMFRFQRPSGVKQRLA